MVAVVVQLFNYVRLFVTPWTVAPQAFLSFSIFQSLLKLMPIESMMPSNHLILCRPLLLPPSIIPCLRVFSSESVLSTRWPNYWSFNFSICPSVNIQGWFPLGSAGLIALLSKVFSRVFSSTIVRRHGFICTQPSRWPNSHIHIWLLEKIQLWVYGSLLAKWCLCFLICCLNLS